MPRQKKVSIEKDYVPIAQAEDLPLAEDCVKLLKGNDIESKIEAAKKSSYLIEVEDGRFHEAYTIIQSHLTAEGFFDIHAEPQQKKDPNQAA